MPSIIGMLRVKNESRWIESVLRSIQPVCSEIFVLDDHSTDPTAYQCAHMGAKVWASPFQGLDETRDKNWLLDQIRPLKPDWILSIDGDEELEPTGPDQIRELVKDPNIWAYAFRILYLWDSPNQIRVDGIYGKFARESLFRLTDDRFLSTTNGGNFHCGNAPRRLARAAKRSGVQLLHYGYMHRADRLRKYEWYNAKDPNNRAEDMYSHMVIGDVFPADSKFRYGGPLQLAALQRVVAEKSA